jgi:hypothetical protein
MEMISQGVFVLAIAWTLWHFVHVRQQLRRGAIVVPPLVAATLVFALGIIVVLVTGVSPWHLVWWFPCSFLMGLVVLVFPLGTALLIRFLVLLAGPLQRAKRPSPQAWKDPRGGARAEQAPALYPDTAPNKGVQATGVTLALHPRA